MSTIFDAIKGLFVSWLGPNIAAIKGHLTPSDIMASLTSAMAILAAVQGTLALIPGGIVPAAWTGFLATTLTILGGLLDLARRLNQGATIQVVNVPVPAGAAPIVNITPLADQGVTVSPPAR